MEPAGTHTPSGLSRKVRDCANTTELLCVPVTSAQMKRYLANQGCTFEPAKGGHLHVYLNGKHTILPMHGSSKEMGAGLVNSIKKALGLK